MYATMEKSMVNFNKTQTDRIFQFDQEKYIFWPYRPACLKWTFKIKCNHLFTFLH